MRKLVLLLCLITPATAQDVTLAALGDSLTQGYGLNPNDGFVPQLENWLAAQGRDVKVINAGVSGDTTAGGKSRIDWTLTEDVDGLLVTLGGNDLLRGLDPETSRANLDAILQAAKAREVPVLLSGMAAPGNFGPEYKAEFDAIFPDLAAQYDTLLVEDFLAPINRAADREAALQDWMQADGIHPNATGVTMIIEEIGPQVLVLLDQIVLGQ